jgi:hypothetical protein
LSERAAPFNDNRQARALKNLEVVLESSLLEEYGLKLSDG